MAVRSQGSCVSLILIMYTVCGNLHVHVQCNACIYKCMYIVLYLFVGVQVFSNMTSNIRKALFKSLMAQSIENENTVIIDNGEEVYMYMYMCIYILYPHNCGIYMYKRVRR